MICRLSGKLEGVEGLNASVTPSAGDVTYAVSIPAYMVEELRTRVGARVTFVTFQYLESQGQGASFLPRLIGFRSEAERRFFEVFTTVKGIGYRRALRALAEEPSAIAGAIIAKDARALSKLPEIGKRLAETIIAELTGKVDGFVRPGELRSLEAAANGSTSAAAGGVMEEAVLALLALGEPRVEAESLVQRALERVRKSQKKSQSTSGSVEDVLGAVFEMRGR